MTLLGRTEELKQLSTIYNSKKSSILVVYGRRRIGKSYLIKGFAQNHPNLCFEGLERAPLKEQIAHFANQLKLQIKDPLLQRAHFNTWDELFEYLGQYLKQRKLKDKIILFFDELPWMASSQNKLVSLIKYYWDNHWQNSNVMLILCGSISSFMVKNIIHSKSLYGRISHELNLGKLSPSESKLFFKHRRSESEILNYLLLFGGIPKYLAEIELKDSFQQNIQKLCFKKDSFFINEYDKIFYSHFREKKTYALIIELLSKGPADLKTIGERLSIPSGGGLKGYLDNLESSGFIKEYLPYNKPIGSKLKRYKLQDEYILFYFKYLLPNKKSIQTLASNQLFSKKVLPNWEAWLGLAFEGFCIQNAYYLAKKLGFADEIDSFGPYFERGQAGFQIDLIFKRMDKVITLCEIKYMKNPVGGLVIAEVEKKARLLKIPKGYSLEKVLIAPNGAEKSVKESEYFHQILELKDLF